MPSEDSDQTAGMHTCQKVRFLTLQLHFFFFSFFFNQNGISYFSTNKKHDVQCMKRALMQFADNAGLLCPLTEPVDTVVYADKQKIPRLDCTDALADSDLPCPQIAYVPLHVLCITCC